MDILVCKSPGKTVGLQLKLFRVMWIIPHFSSSLPPTVSYLMKGFCRVGHDLYIYNDCILDEVCVPHKEWTYLGLTSQYRVNCWSIIVVFLLKNIQIYKGNYYVICL